MLNDIWRGNIFIGVVAAIVVFCFHQSKRIGPLLAITWGYFLLASARIFLNPDSPFQAFGQQFDQTTGQAFAQLLIFPLAVLYLDKRGRKIAWLLILGAACYSMLSMITGGDGLFLARSFDGAYLAAIAFLFHPALYFVLIVAALLTGSRTAMMIILGQFLIQLIRRPGEPRPPRKIILASLLFCAPLMGLMAYMHRGGEWLASLGRVPEWALVWKWWTAQDIFTLVFGTGNGSFVWLGTYLSLLKNKIFLQLHNDWYQCLIEGGAVGCALIAASYIYILRRAMRLKIYRELWVGIGIFAITYHPLRFFWSELFIILTAVEIIERTGGVCRKTTVSVGSVKVAA